MGVAALLLGGGCGDTNEPGGNDSGDVADGTMDSGADTGVEPFTNMPCDEATRAGGFTVQLEDGFTQVEGQVFDAPDPTPKTEVDAADGCRLLIAQNNFCDPPCGASGACTAELTCVDKPVAVAVGEVTIDGLAADVTMEPNVTNFYLNLDTLPHPGFEPGAEIELRADGGDGEGFTLQGIGGASFEVLMEEVPLSRELPVALSWTPPADGAATRVHIDVDIGHHGGSPATIECDVDDTGAFEIPATLVTQLFDFGVAGFPEISMTRSTVDSATVGGRCVDLIVAPTTVELAVVIDGVQSCSGNDECPDGQTCQPDLSCG